MLGISAVCLVLAYAVMEIQSLRAEKKKSSNLQGNAVVTASGKAHIGGDWQLTDTSGKTLSNKDLEGSYYLIYFGFTNCPDICPNSLNKLAKAIQKVKKTKEGSLFKIKSIFVSVDPDRDTPEKIVKFLEFFDPEMIGVTAKSN